MEKELITFINETFSVSLKSQDYAHVKAVLAEKINDWINNDFNKLIHVLYRVDVSEAKINQLLKDSPTTYAADILADLIIERQLVKIETRKRFTPPKSDGPEEKW